MTNFFGKLFYILFSLGLKVFQVAPYYTTAASPDQTHIIIELRSSVTSSETIEPCAILQLYLQVTFRCFL